MSPEENGFSPATGVDNGLSPATAGEEVVAAGGGDLAAGDGGEVAAADRDDAAADRDDAAADRQAAAADREEAAAETVRRVSRLREAVVALDSRPDWIDAARRWRERLPGDERFGDPLSTTGVAPVQVIARGVSALKPARASFMKELGLAGLQVWQSLSESAGRGRGDRELAILFTDLVGFSTWALKAGDTAALELLRAVGFAVENAIESHEGRIVKRLGDGVMATFLTAQAALEAALDAQEALTAVEVHGYRPRMRAGIHLGKPRKLGGDYLGVDVNIAARVAESAKAEQVVVTDAALARLDFEGVRKGRRRRLRADGTPSDLRVAPISRVPSQSAVD
jgi:adenylate cyclase